MKHWYLNWQWVTNTLPIQCLVEYISSYLPFCNGFNLINCNRAKPISIFLFHIICYSTKKVSWSTCTGRYRAIHLDLINKNNGLSKYQLHLVWHSMYTFEVVFITRADKFNLKLMQTCYWLLSSMTYIWYRYVETTIKYQKLHYLLEDCYNSFINIFLSKVSSCQPISWWHNCIDGLQGVWISAKNNNALNHVPQRLEVNICCIKLIVLSKSLFYHTCMSKKTCDQLWQQ